MGVIFGFISRLHYYVLIFVNILRIRKEELFFFLLDLKFYFFTTLFHSRQLVFLVMNDPLWISLKPIFLTMAYARGNRKEGGVAA